MPSPTTSSYVSNVANSGNVNIDALLSGVRWGQSNQSVEITYSFPWKNGFSAIFSGPNGSTYSSENEPYADQRFGFNESQQKAANDALSAWASVANIKFKEVIETNAFVGDIRFAFRSGMDDNVWGYAYYPNQYYPSAGDIWVDASYGSEKEWGFGSYNFEALMHEIGHAIGLKHTFSDGAKLPANFENRLYSIMSYTDPVKNVWQTDSLSNGTYSWSWHNINPETPMVLDILAVQYVYGANYQYNSGDTVYYFDPKKPFFKTIWDGGGTDTISAKDFNTNCQIDLNPGKYSSLGFLYEANSAVDRSHVTYDGTNNLGIAYGCTIENIISGSGDDQLIGNDRGNKIDAGSGNDSIIGSKGNDTIDGNSGTDRIIFSGAMNDYQVKYSEGHYIVTSPDGIDDITNVEYFEFSDTIVMSKSFIVDTLSPKLVASIPSDKEQSVSDSSTIVFFFDEVIVKGNGEVLIKIGDKVVEKIDISTSSCVTIEGEKLIIDPPINFANLSTYSVVLPAGAVKDLAGNQLENSAVFEFSTKDINLINGSTLSEVLSGTVDNDKVYAFAGDDTINSGPGNDLLFGGDGKDFLYGDSGNDSIYGGNASDNLYGGDGNDYLDGGLGEDRFYGGAGNDTIIGGDEYELAFYSGVKSNYTITISPNDIRVFDRAGVDGEDSVSGIKIINFLNQAIILQTFEETASLQYGKVKSLVELYIASFNRAPDAFGLNYWGSQLASGAMDLAQIAKSFFVQPETIAAYPSSQSTAIFVTKVYENVLSRGPDEGGLKYWIDAIDSGRISKDIFLLAIINGANAASGSAADKQTLVNKTLVGMDFAFTEGLSNTVWAADVMSTVNSTANSVVDAKARTDAYAIAATASGTAELTVKIIGFWDGLSI